MNTIICIIIIALIAAYVWFRFDMIKGVIEDARRLRKKT